jgi:hypothetical protein
MARWTQSVQETNHLVQTNKSLYKALEDGFIIKLIKNNGEEFEGVYAGNSVSNDGPPNNPATNYCSDITLHLLNADTVTTDILDIQEIFDVTSPDKVKEYADAGVIIIDDFYNSKS